MIEDICVYFRIFIKKLFKIRERSDIQLDRGNGLNIKIVAMVSQKMNVRKKERRSENIDDAIPLGCFGIDTTETRFVVINVFKNVSWFYNVISLSELLDGKLREEFFNFYKFIFGHKRDYILFVIFVEYLKKGLGRWGFPVNNDLSAWIFGR